MQEIFTVYTPAERVLSLRPRSGTGRRHPQRRPNSEATSPQGFTRDGHPARLAPPRLRLPYDLVRWLEQAEARLAAVAEMTRALIAESEC